MTVANKVAAKASVAFVAIAMALALFAPAAQAQTEAEMQAQIDQLLATIAALQAQMGGDTTSTGGSCPTLTAPLTIGAQGANVTALQTYLIAEGHSIPAGATGYFGSQTQAAVAAWQAANAVSPAAGYWGPVSLAKYNAICTSDDDDDDDDDDSTSGELDGGEASLESFTSSDGDDTDLEEGQEAAPVAEFEFDVEDGDVEVNRIDVAFDWTSGANSDDEPWEVFDEVSIWVDGDEVASMDASDEDEWSDDDPYDGAHTLRFSGMDWVVREGETAQFTVGVTVAGSVDGSADPIATWEVFIPADGIRAEDSEGIQNYIGEDDSASQGVLTEAVSFDIEEEGGDDELIIGTSSEDPDATTLMVEESSNSDWLTVFAFDMDTDDSTNDIEVNTVILDVHTPGETYNAVVNDARLVIDGEEYDDFSVARGTTATATLTFDIDGDLVIEAGEEVTAELQLEFTAVSNYDEGDQIEALATTTSLWDAEGVDDVTPSGSASGELHTLRTSGISVVGGETTEDTQGENDTLGVFTIEFDVTAFEGDFYITDNATTSTAVTDGVVFSVNGGTATTSGVLTSTGDEDTSGVFTVEEGETETFTLTVSVDPTSTGIYSVEIDEIWFTSNSNGTSSTSMHTPTPAADYRTGNEPITG